MQTLAEPKPYTVSEAADIFGTITVKVIFPKIGSGASIAVEMTTKDRTSIPGMVNHALKEFVKELIVNYHKSHEHRFQFGNQTAEKMNALGALKQEIKQMGAMGYREHISRYFLPVMQKLATQNSKSRFYKYDNDVIAFLQGVIANPPKLVL